MFYRVGFLLCMFCASVFSTEHVYLKAPNLARENIIGTQAGIRPFRKSGVRIEAELVKDKLIIHNYGYGGSGLTLSFGGAQEVMDILDQQKHPAKTVAILGAGVVGLVTAYELLEKGYTVHIYSDAWIPNLTSNVAAGIWSPLILDEIADEKKELHQRMLDNSEQRFQKSAHDSPEFAGVRLIDAYSFESHGTTKKVHSGEDVIVHLDNGVVKKGKRKREIGLDGKLFLEDLYTQVKSKGAMLQQRHFETVEDILNLEEPLIINCTSMGSLELFNDQELVPVRGQVIYFKPQEGIDYLFAQNVPDNADDSKYFVFTYPWSDRIILGGVYEFDQVEPMINSEAINSIIRYAERCFSGDL